MAVSYLRRSKPVSSYVPLLSLLALIWWSVGVGLWVHYTTLAENKAKDIIDILQVTAVTGGAIDHLPTVRQGIIATSTVYGLLAVLAHAAASARSHLDSSQDAEGQLNPSLRSVLTWGAVVLQVCWWTFTAWLGVVLLGSGAFAGVIYISKQQLSNSVVLQTNMPSSMSSAELCPVPCLNLASTGIFANVSSLTPAQYGVLCSCVGSDVQAAQLAAEDAFNAVPGMLIGIMFMLLNGCMFLVYLARFHGQLQKEEDFSERLEAGVSNGPSGAFKGR